MSKYLSLQSSPGIKLLERRGVRFVWRLNLQFEPRDLWVGIFWRRSLSGLLHLYICIVPLFPLHFTLLDKMRLESEQQGQIVEES